jgi:hypothetical protein
MTLALSTTGALELTAYATLALALVTGGLVVATFRSLGVAKGALAQTEKAIAVSQGATHSNPGRDRGIAA